MKNDVINLSTSERWHIGQIYICREKLQELAKKGEPLSSEKMVKLANKLTTHWMKVEV